MKSILFSVLILLVTQVQAEEFTAMLGVTAFNFAFTDHAAEFEKETKIKIRYLGVPQRVSGKDVFRATVEGQVDLGGSAIEPDEWKMMMAEDGVSKDAIATAKFFVIGDDLIHIVAHADNPVKKLSFAQLEKIFTGETKNWKEVGGRDLTIIPVVMSDQPATMQSFRVAAMNRKEFTLGSVNVPSQAEMNNFITKNRGAISFCSTSLKLQPGAKEIEAPPIRRPVTLVTKGYPKEPVAKFIRFLEKRLKK